MSTTYDVYSGSKTIPTFSQVLDRTTGWYHQRLRELGVLSQPALTLRLLEREGDHPRHFAPEESARWGEDLYAWFEVEGVPGGVDAYFEADKEWLLSCWEGQLEYHDAPQVRHALEMGYRWSFRRSAGQLGPINLLHGLLAAAFAHLTDGVVCSEDCAWGYRRLPAKGEEMASWYFNCVEKESLEAENSERSIQGILECFDSTSF